MELQFECITIDKNEGTSAILGHAGFIKTVEDLYEAMVGSVPGVKFGIAFAEASGPCLVRSDGNDDGLRRQAENNILKIAAGHTFLILFTEAYPINCAFRRSRPLIPTDRDQLFRLIATSAARVLRAPLDDGGDVSLLFARQARREAVPVVNRRDPRATRSALMADAAARAGGPC